MTSHACCLALFLVAMVLTTKGWRKSYLDCMLAKALCVSAVHADLPGFTTKKCRNIYKRYTKRTEEAIEDRSRNICG
ncbi:hypothetical protein ScPMuIL_001231 [Solemya velum]